MKEIRHEPQWKGRIKVAVGGAFFVVLGFSPEHRGKPEWTNYYGQNIFSVGIMVLGGLLIVLAVIPNSWVAKIAVVDKKKPVRFHHNSTSRSGKN